MQHKELGDTHGIGFLGSGFRGIQTSSLAKTPKWSDTRVICNIVLCDIYCIINII